MIVNLNDILLDTLDKNYAIAGFNVFGYEDAAMVVKAAEEIRAPVILMTNRDALEHMPVEIMAKMLIQLADNAKVPVCVHLDHGKSVDEVVAAIKAGYTSVMYDGSQLSIEENIRNTKEIARIAHLFGVTIEGEIGSVGYSTESLNVKSIYTEPEDAKRFVEETEIDAVAVAIGTLHRMQAQEAEIQYDRLEKIEKLVNIPLVIHGSTGIKDEDLRRLCRHRVGKINIGTALRMAFGNTMRIEFEKKPNEFDRIKLFKKPMIEVKEAAMKKMRILGLGNQECIGGLKSV